MASDRSLAMKGPAIPLYLHSAILQSHFFPWLRFLDVRPRIKIFEIKIFVEFHDPDPSHHHPPPTSAITTLPFPQFSSSSQKVFLNCGPAGVAVVQGINLPHFFGACAAEQPAPTRHYCADRAASVASLCQTGEKVQK